MSKTKEINKTRLIGITIGFIAGGYIYQSALSTGDQTAQLLGIFIIIVVLIAVFSDQ